MAQYEELLGPILISSWLTAILYGVTICKVWEYVVVYPKTLWFRKGLLLSCAVTSSLALIAEFANVYYPTVTFWGNTAAIQTQYWPVPVYVVCNSLTGIMVDGFLIHRVYRLSQNIWVALFLIISVILALVGSIMVSVIITMANQISSRDKAAAAALVWTIGTAGSDIFITVALIWKLCTMRTAFFSTDSLIRRLAIGAIQTGSTTSTISIATMVSYYIGKDGSNAPTAFHYLIGPCYLLTLLYNLTLQPHDRVGKSGTSGFGETEAPNFCMDGIHVHRTEVISTELISARRPTVISRIYCDKKPNEVAADCSYSSHLTA
ncbi:hypothetical protein MSAN_00594000 [Mycena sanguinolenta]|uniref:DUF6534 domain-containing protein n=1 Tax=Mycena sanguinolenta TaxID=230812 RepID=A0A8H6Z7N4_9AGAR|nr:hypothetical protein MSAN_00594000 [Mycena sanguinolenta]